MKKLLLLISTVALVSSCAMNEEPEFAPASETYEFIGYNGVQTRTQFGEPTGTEIPFLWSEGDYIWIGSNQSEPIAENCEEAKFSFTGSLSIVGDYYPVFYNLTGEHKNAKVLAEQSAANNLGENGDFGFAKADEYRVFMLEHRTSYLWFNTTTPDAEMPKLTSITVTAADDIALAGKSVFDYENEVWSTVTEGTNEVVLSFGEGVELQSANEDIFATMVTLPATIANTDLTIKYTFDDGSTYTEVKTPTVNLEIGQTLRISTDIEKADLVKEPSYELRILTFEDKDKQFNAYELEYGDWWTIEKWSDLIPEMQYGDPKTYGDGGMGGGDARYTWWDEGNTDIKHTFTNAWDMDYYCYWSGGHVISNHTKPNYTNDDLRPYVEEYYENTGADVDAILEYAGWQMLQLMTPIGAHSGDNFAVHYGYQDEKSQGMSDRLAGFEFDGEPRVIDHMWVTLTNYTLNQLVYGVWQPGVSKPGQGGFGGNYVGLTTDSNLKIVAYGYRSKDYGFGADDQGEDYCDSKSEFYLVKDGVPLTEWAKWDLSELGEVAHVNFNFEYSDDMGGREGFTIPAYFAYDDVAVRVNK